MLSLIKNMNNIFENHTHTHSVSGRAVRTLPIATVSSSTQSDRLLLSASLTNEKTVAFHPTSLAVAASVANSTESTVFAGVTAPAPIVPGLKLHKSDTIAESGQWMQLSHVISRSTPNNFFRFCSHFGHFVFIIAHDSAEACYLIIALVRWNMLFDYCHCFYAETYCFC